MRKNILFILLIPAAVICLTDLNGCSSQVTEPDGIITYSKDIQPIFISYCSFPGCHNPVNKPYGIDLTGWSSIMLNGSKYGAEIIPYNARWSHLIQHINIDTNTAPVSEPRMPKPLLPYTNGNPLPYNITQKIMRWIDEGAKNDNGEIAYSGITHKAFMTNQASDYVAVVNTDNNFVTRYIKVGETTGLLAAPHNVMVDNQGSYFYVTLISEGFVEKYNARTYEKAGRMYSVTSPGHVIITPNGLKGYVTNYSLNFSERYIKSFNTQTMQVINTISDITMYATHGGRITRDGKYLITVSELGEFIQIIRTSDDYLEQTIPVDPSVPSNGNGTGNFRSIAVSISPDDKYAFITCDKSNEVRVLNINTRIITAVIPVGLFPIQSECTPDGKWLYVANRNSNSVTVININSLSVYKTIPGIGAQPHGVAITPDGHYAYVTCESVNGTFVHHPLTGSYRPGTTAVIDILNGHIKVKDIEMASFPAGVSITRQ
jgi:YVTN family beta-propeller protein